MNAPTPATALAPASLESIPLHFIQPSQTPLQQLRRARFNEAKLIELAESIKTQGVLQPVLLRPFRQDGAAARDAIVAGVKYELVAGERRWIGAGRAGLDQIHAIVRVLTDDQVIEAQLVENLQREDSDALYEAEGYHALMSVKQITADEVAAVIGKSRSYVYARLKLRELCPEVRAALDAGAIDASKALLIARLGAEKLQSKALKIASEANWRGEPISYKATFEQLRGKLMADLRAAPFPMDGLPLFRFEKIPGRRGHEEAIELPACAGCPANSANDAELQRELPANAHVCTDPACFEAKSHAWSALVLKKARDEGRSLIEGEAAKQIAPRKDKLVGFVDLDEACENDDFDEKADPEPEPATDAEEDSPAFKAKCDAWQQRYNAHRGRTYRQLLGADHKLPVTLLKDPKTGRVRELVPVKEVKALLAKKHEIKLPGSLGAPEPKRPAPPPRIDYKEEHRKREERFEQEKAWRSRLLVAIAAKCAGPIKRDELVDMADSMIEHDRYALKEGLKAVYPKLPEPGQLKDPDLGKFIRLALVAEEVARCHGAPSSLLALAKRYKIDVAKLKKEFAAEARAITAAKKTEK